MAKETNEDILKSILEKGNPKQAASIKEQMQDVDISGFKKLAKTLSPTQTASEVGGVLRGSISKPIANQETPVPVTTGKAASQDNKKVIAQLDDQKKQLTNIATNTNKTNTLLDSLIKLQKTNNEDNKNLLTRLLESNEAQKTISEEDKRHSKGGTGTKGKGTVGGATGGSGTGDKEGGGFNLKDMLIGGAEAFGAYKLLKGAGGKAAAEGVAKGATKGAAKAEMTAAEKAAAVGAERFAKLKSYSKFGLLGAGAGALYGTLSGEDNQLESTIIGGAAGIAGKAAYEGGKSLLGKAGEVTEKMLTPKVAEEAAAPRFKQTSNGRWIDTEKGIGGGSFISNEEAKKAGLEVTEKSGSKAAAATEKGAAEVAKGSITKAVTDPLKGAAEAVKGTVSKAGEVGAKVVEKVTPEIIKKTIEKVAGNSAVKAAAKKIPGVSVLAGLAFGISRAMEGDFKGAAGEVTSGVVGTLPVAGTAGSLAIDAGLIARDVYKELYGVFPDDEPDAELRSSRIGEITTMVTDYVKGLVGSENKQEEEKAPTGNIQPGVTPDTDMGFQVTGNDSKQQTEEKNKGKIEPTSQEAKKFINQKMSEKDSKIDTGLPEATQGNYLTEAVVQKRNLQSAYRNTPPTGEGNNNVDETSGISVTSKQKMYEAMGNVGQTGLNNAPPIIVNRGGDTINNITNASSGGGGGGGSAGTPSRAENPWDKNLFGRTWEAYP